MRSLRRPLPSPPATCRRAPRRRRRLRPRHGSPTGWGQGSTGSPLGPSSSDSPSFSPERPSCSGLTHPPETVRNAWSPRVRKPRPPPFMVRTLTLPDAAAILPEPMPDRPAGPTPTRRFRYTCIHCGRGVNTRARIGAYHRCPHCSDQPPAYGMNPGSGIIRAVADAPATPPVKRRRTKPPAPPPASTPAASPTAAPPRAPRRRAVVAAPPPQPATSQAAPAGDIAPAPPPAPPAKRRHSLVDRILGHDEDD